VLKIHRAHASEFHAEQPGKRIVHQGLPAMTTCTGILVIDELQPAGKNKLDGKTFLRGARGWEE
jgi:methionyl-tRNA formyltransferase